MQENSKRVLVTGAGGFLGKRLTTMLLQKGQQVRALVHTVEKKDSWPQHPLLEVIEGDITRPEEMVAATRDCDQVYHLAAVASDWARDPRIFYQVNFQGTLNVLEAARKSGVQRCVVTSTMGIIGPPDPSNVVPVDENHVRWVNFFTEYASSKILAEERLQQFVRGGQDIVVVNPTRIYGPGTYDRKNGLVMLIDHYLHRPFAIVPGSRDVIGNYVYLDDVCQGHILAMEKGRPGEKYILGGENMDFSTILHHVRDLTGRKGRILRIPFFLIGGLALGGWLKAKILKKQPFVTFSYLRKISYQWPVSSEKAMRELGYRPTPPREALDQTLRWVREYKGKG